MVILPWFLKWTTHTVLSPDKGCNQKALFKCVMTMNKDNEYNEALFDEEALLQEENFPPSPTSMIVS